MSFGRLCYQATKHVIGDAAACIPHDEGLPEA
jgi:hypothetical protein